MRAGAAGRGMLPGAAALATELAQGDQEARHFPGGAIEAARAKTLKAFHHASLLQIT